MARTRIYLMNTADKPLISGLICVARLYFTALKWGLKGQTVLCYPSEPITERIIQ